MQATNDGNGGVSRYTVACVLLAAALLMLALSWHLPMMLWDHIDLVPMYEAWRQGSLGTSAFWSVHDGSHLHIAAYAVLLLTTALSGGQPWLDCVASFILLAVQAWVLMRIVRDGLGASADGVWRYLLLLLALYPGHLVNLQWGWQVAVFISTLGAVSAIRLLTLPSLGQGTNGLAVLVAAIGVLGFSTTLAVFPVAVMLVMLHPAPSRAAKWGLAVPWVVACAALLGWLSVGRADASMPAFDMAALARYALNYLGAGISRLATALAPAWALLALLTAAWTLARRWSLALRPWLALMLFGMGCALMTGLGRVGEYGPEHAFVTRYVSFSSLFWFGWVGLLLAAWREVPVAWRRWVRPLLSMLLVFVLANAVHMVKQAREIHERATVLAAHIRGHYPDVGQAEMEEAFGWRAPFAHEYLGRLRARGYAPFRDEEVRPGDAP